MNKMWNKKSSKWVATGLLIIAMMLTTVLPVWAIEGQIADISPWAVSDLNEGEKYGIYPMEWYYEDFRAEVSQERLEVLLEKTADKIAATGVETKEDFLPVPYKGEGTRGDVIIRLFNVLAQYGLTGEKTPVEYMQERGILQGTSKGLELDNICTTEQAVILATRLVADTYNQLDAGAKGLAWKVENDGNIVYLLGSIHVGSSDLYPLNQRLLKAFYESDVLVVEANILNQDDGMDYYIANALYWDGTTLADVVSEEVYDKLITVLEVYGLPVEEFAVFKPWSIANTLQVLSMTNSGSAEQGAESANLGIDMYFLLNAFLTQKPVFELEGMKYQVDLFEGLSAEFQEEYLEAILDSILHPQDEETTTSADLLNEWLTLWKKGDIEGFTNSFAPATEETENELTTMLFGKRDKDMAEKIIMMLESEQKGTYFVVVGAGHLTIENSVLDHLTEMGYEVEVLQ